MVYHIGGVMDIYNRQEKLELDSDVSVTVVGCGGVGFWVCKMLAMSGIKKIRAYDPDVLEDSNLNRIDVSYDFIGRNKADITKFVVKNLRPECDIKTFPYKLNDMHIMDTDWLVDCTDNMESQVENMKIAEENRMKFMKVGYDGEHISINDKVATWGENDDGYRIVPSWVVPANIIASLAVAKIMKYNNKEISTDLVDMYYERGN